MARSENAGGLPRLKTLFVLALVFAVGIVFAGLFNVGLSATNETEFCISCHSMKTNPMAELEESLHWNSASGVSAGCADCHVPKSFFPKLMMKVMAAKDVYHEIMGTVDTPEKFEALRWKMANRVWDKMKANDSRECRTCHSFERMDLAEQDRSARKRHARAEDEGDTCIDCHKGVAHEEPDEPEEEEEEGEEG